MTQSYNTDGRTVTNLLQCQQSNQLHDSGMFLVEVYLVIHGGSSDTCPWKFIGACPQRTIELTDCSYYHLPAILFRSASASAPHDKHVAASAVFLAYHGQLSVLISDYRMQ